MDSWKVFENFLQDMGERPPGTSLDRIDNDKGYSLENCRWASWVEQQNNRRDTIKLTLNGEEVTLSNLARECEIPYRRLYNDYCQNGLQDLQDTLEWASHLDTYLATAKHSKKVMDLTPMNIWATLPCMV